MSDSDPSSEDRQSYLDAYHRFGNRKWGDDDDRISLIIKDLRKLAFETQPSAGAESSEDKNRKAGHALSLANELFLRLAGWAVDHDAGKALADREDTDLDRHEHEERGSLFSVGHDTPDPELSRKVLISLLWDLHSILPHNLATIAHDDLEALKFGETRGICIPASLSSRGDGYTGWRLRLNAISHIAFFQGQRMKKGEAEDLVGRAYGLSSGSIRKWEARCRREFGSRQVDKKIWWGKHFGALWAESSFKIPRSDRDLLELKSLSQRWGEAALERDGQAYLMSQRTSAH